MRMRTILTAAAMAVAIIVPAQASAATLRVVSGTANIFGATTTTVASASAYVDSKGKRHTLKPNTVLGQIATTGLPYTAVYSAGLGAYLTKIVGVKAPKQGYWSLLINGKPSMVGAADARLKATDSVVWIADTDYSSKNGPFTYDLTATPNANGTVTFTGSRIGGAKPIIAGGAPLTVNGTVVGNLDKQGQLTITPPATWTASIGAKLKIVGSGILSS